MNDIARNVNIAAVAELISDPSRAAMLDALMGKQALPAGELARRAGIAPQTASTHLSKLVDGGLLLLIRQGRHRYYQLASADVARALEALATIAPTAEVHSQRESLAVEQLRSARTCYDHLAGKLGIQLIQALHDHNILQFEEQDRRYRVTEEGTRFLTQFGIDLEQLQELRRAFALPCLDWSERRYHLAGALGAAFADRFFQLGWIERLPAGRAVRLTESGRAGFTKMFGEQVRW
jgi:DNA-binding transcriptional ArsR family regulator